MEDKAAALALDGQGEKAALPKGPWAWQCTSSCEPSCGSLIDADGNAVINLCCSRCGGPSVNPAAMPMLAEAPAMLEALQDTVAVLTADTVGTIYMDDPNWYMRLAAAVGKARAVISRATGQATSTDTTVKS